MTKQQIEKELKKNIIISPYSGEKQLTHTGELLQSKLSGYTSAQKEFVEFLKELYNSLWGNYDKKIKDKIKEISNE